MVEEPISGMTEPLVSIGLPTRNRVATLARAAESVLAQDWARLELVISDNASTDDTAAVCERLQREDPRVRYIRQSEDLGAQANFRAVLAESRGQLFMWLADDDWLDPGYVSACARVLVERPDHALVCGRARCFRNETFAFAERPLNLLGSSRRGRVLGFYRTVTLNGAFYGLVRREQISELPFPNVDWLLVASRAYLGKVRTLHSPSLNRSIEGASKDAEALGRGLGLSGRETRNWHLFVARAAYDDIMRSPVYRSAGRLDRWALASGAWLLVVARFSWKVWLGRLLLRMGLFDRARAVLESKRRRSG